LVILSEMEEKELFSKWERETHLLYLVNNWFKCHFQNIKLTFYMDKTKLVINASEPRNFIRHRAPCCSPSHTWINFYISYCINDNSFHKKLYTHYFNGIVSANNTVEFKWI
jgi:hypothetical protein